MTDAILSAFQGVLDDDTAQEVIDYRKRMGRKYALTERSARMLAKNLARCGDPIAAAEEMIVRGWQSIKPEWMPKAKPKSIGDMFREDAIRMGILPNDQPTHARAECLEASHRIREGGGSGFALDATFAGDIIRRH